MPRKYKAPSRKCNGHKRNGEPCGHFAMVGQTKCYNHGGMAGRDGKAMAEERHYAASMLQDLLAEDPRPLEVVLQDALHNSDTAMREVQARVAAGDNTPATLSELMESSRFAAAMVTNAIRLGVTVRREEQRELYAASVVKGIRGILNGLDLTTAQRNRIPELAREHLAQVAPDYSIYGVADQHASQHTQTRSLSPASNLMRGGQVSSDVVDSGDDLR